jgi:hypothetical protein
MNPDVVEELKSQIEFFHGLGYTEVLEHALAEIIRLNDIIEQNRAMHDEIYGRNSNARNQELFK